MPLRGCLTRISHAWPALALLVALASPALALTASAGHEVTIAPGQRTLLHGAAAGGTAPYAFFWSPAAGLSAGNVAEPIAAPAVSTTYTLTVTDGAGATATDTVTVTVRLQAEAGPDAVLQTGRTVSLPGCVRGGQPPYTYAWSPAAGLDSTTVARPTATMPGAAGTAVTYTLTVTDAAGQVAQDAITLQTTDSQAACMVDAGADVALPPGRSVTLQGQTSGLWEPCTVSWSPATGLSDPTVLQPVARPSATTTYTLTVTDAFGWTGSDTVTVYVGQSPGPFWASAGPDRTIYSGQSVTLRGQADGGLAPYTWSWSPATGLSSTTAKEPTARPIATTTYTLTARDSQGAVMTDTVVVTVLPTTATTLRASAGGDQVLLEGQSATLSGYASGGLPPYTYAWSPATGLSATNVARPVASPAYNTVYTLTVTDSRGATTDDTVLVEVFEPLAVEAGSDRTLTLPETAVLSPTVTGGWLEFGLGCAWSPPDGLSNPFILNPVAAPAVTTTYTVTVNDALDQYASDSVTLTVVPPLVAEAGPDVEVPLGGSTMLCGGAAGGTPPYALAWAPADSLDDPAAASPVARPLETTTYTLTVTDALGWVAVDTVTVTAPTYSFAAEAGPEVTMVAGSSTLLQGAAVGGCAPFSYTWSPAAGLSDPHAASPLATPAATTTYTLTITDALGNTREDVVTVTVVPLLVVEAGPDRIIQPGGSTLLEGAFSGGAPGATWSWSPATGLEDASLLRPTARPASTTVYTLRVTDSAGQTVSDSVTVYVLGAFSAEAGPDLTIVRGATGTLYGGATGGQAPYTYTWSPAAGLSDPYVAEPLAGPAETTTYTLTVTDALGQAAQDSVTVTVLEPLVAEAGPDVAVIAGTGAALSGSGSGGQPPYTWSWTPTAGLSDATTAAPTAAPTTTTTYTLTVTDAAGRSASDQVTVTVVPLLVASAGLDKEISAGESALLEGSASGGVQPYAWSWSPSDGLDDPAAAAPTAAPGVTTTYTLTVCDASGQTATDSVTVTVRNQAPSPAFTWLPAVPVAGEPVAFSDGSRDPDGSIVSWSWDFGDGGTAAGPNPSHTFAAADTYTVTLTVTDDRGATATATRAVTVSAGRVSLAIELNAPNKAKSGKHSDLAVVVTNTGSVAAEVSVTLERMGASPGNLGTRVISLAAGKHDRLTFPYTFATADVPAVTFRATALAAGVSVQATATVTVMAK